MLDTVAVKNITVLKDVKMEFVPGINVIQGESRTGKTHLLKLLYSACKAGGRDGYIPYEITHTLAPDMRHIEHLVSRNANYGARASLQVTSGDTSMSIAFDRKAKMWDAETIGSDRWERRMRFVRGIFIPENEILSHAWNLSNAIRRGNVDFDDTYDDVVSAAFVNMSSEMYPSGARRELLNRIEAVLGGTVCIGRNQFYLMPHGQREISLRLLSESEQRLALLWQLVNNGVWGRCFILFWDNPLAGIGRKEMDVVADAILQMQRSGTQIFITTRGDELPQKLLGMCEPTDSMKVFSLD